MPKRMKGDRNGIAGITFAKPWATLGTVMIMTASLSVFLRMNEWFQGGFWVDVFNLSPLLVMIGIMLVVANWTFDWRWMVIPAFMITVLWYWVVMSPAL